MLPVEQRIYLRRAHHDATNGGAATGKRQKQHGVDIHKFGKAVAQLLQDIAFRQIHLENRVQVPMTVFFNPHRHEQTDRRLRRGAFVIAK